MANFPFILVGVLQAMSVPFAARLHRLTLNSGEQGQGLSEYVLLVALMVGLVVSAITLFTSPLAMFYDNMLNSFELIFSGATL